MHPSLRPDIDNSIGLQSATEMNDVEAGPFLGGGDIGGESRPEHFAIGGELGCRLARALARLQQMPYCREYLFSQLTPDPDQWTNFPRFHGDICGRYLIVQTLAHGTGPRPTQRLADVLEHALRIQCPDGSFGVDDGPSRLPTREKIYGNGWMLRGLCCFAARFCHAGAQVAAIRLGRYYEAIASRWNATYEDERQAGAYAASLSCFYHAIDGLVALARLTGDTTWRRLARSFLPFLTPLDQADHAHMYLTIRRGLLELFVDEVDHVGISRLVEECEQFHHTCTLEHGGVPERLVHLHGDRDDEGCAIADWLLLTNRLYEVTGDAIWRERAILCLENSLYYNQCTNGGFGSCALGAVYLQQGKEAPWCCSLAVPVALITVAGSWVRLIGNVLDMAHLVSGRFTFRGNQEVVITCCPRQGSVRIDATNAPNIQHVVLRIPHWLRVEAGECKSGRCTVPLIDGRAELRTHVVLWTSHPGQPVQQAEVSSGVARRFTLFLGPWLLTHRLADDSVPVRLRRMPDGSLAGWSARMVSGLGHATSVPRVTLAHTAETSSHDVFRGVFEGPGKLWTYALKDKESPNQSRSVVTVTIDA